MASESEHHRAPEGAHCTKHPEREAHFTCPRCGHNACLSCWHPSVARCAQCLSLDPSETAPAIPWERPGGSALLRYLATFASAFSPVRSAPAFARKDLPAARRFMLLSALPLALLAGIIPHTRTLLFEGNFAVRLVGHPSTSEIVLDVLRAALSETVLTAVQLGCLLLPYVSLVRAYGAPQREEAAVRVMYYRIWLLPAALLLFHLAVWALPTPDLATLEQAPPASWLIVLSLGLLGSVLLMLAMTATARLACGLGPWLSMLVVLVPVTLLLLISPLAVMGIEHLLPSSPALTIDRHVSPRH
jgi:hypothetical protein